MTREQLNKVLSAVDNNGLDYALRHQSDWLDIDDNFQSYLAQYKAAADLVEKYLMKMDDFLEEPKYNT